MPNVWLAPGPRDVTPDDLISGVDDGILIEGDGSFSIDQQRYNFQFGGDAFWEIKGGKKRGMLSRVAYQAKTTDFWQPATASPEPATGSSSDRPSMAKANPSRSTPSATAARPSRFRQINVLLTD